MSNPAKASIETFLGNQFCLIVEPSAAFSSNIQACLKSVGVAPTRILIARRYEDARRMIEAHKPCLLVTEYEVEKHFGLSLVELQEQVFKGPVRASMIVTRNSSDSVVAEAAEEQVDAFLLKPFSVETFREKLLQVLERKANPSPYATRISEGKKLFEGKEFRKAAEIFASAKSLSDKPSLACYYTGSALLQQGDRAGALKEFQEGRKHQPLHYKCLTSEFDILVGEKRYAEAYALVPTIKDNYPLTPRRLSQIFICAVFTYKFSDLAVYFDLFCRLEHRPSDLVKVVSMALFTAGKYFVEKNAMDEAMQMFDRGATVAGRSLAFLQKVVDELLKAKAYKEAQIVLGKALQSDRGTPEYNRLGFRVDMFVLRKDQLIEKGRKLIMTGEGNPEIYEIVVKLMAEEGKVTLAEAVINRAIADFPNMRAALYTILENSAPNDR
ncbi:MAG: hypothetical protein AB7G93_09205 [Bdellovibrionales bacterium]